MEEMPWGSHTQKNMQSLEDEQAVPETIKTAVTAKLYDHNTLHSSNT